MANYCPFHVRYYNDGKRSITNELLVAVQNSWAAEKDFIGTDRVKKEEILPHEGIERGSFRWCKESLTFTGAALQKNVLCFRPLVSKYFTGTISILSSGKMHFHWIWGSSLHKVISTSAMWGKGLNQKICIHRKFNSQGFNHFSLPRLELQTGRTGMFNLPVHYEV